VDAQAFLHQCSLVGLRGYGGASLWMGARESGLTLMVCRHRWQVLNAASSGVIADPPWPGAACPEAGVVGADPLAADALALMSLN
jgi:hypothetical protein